MKQNLSFIRTKRKYESRMCFIELQRPMPYSSQKYDATSPTSDAQFSASCLQASPDDLQIALNKATPLYEGPKGSTWVQPLGSSLRRPVRTDRSGLIPSSNKKTKRIHNVGSFCNELMFYPKRDVGMLCDMIMVALSCCFWDF